MKKYFLIPFLLIIILFNSCELAQRDYDYEINLLNIALDYHNTNVTSLYGTLNDAKEIEKALRENCEKNEINYTSYNYYQEGTAYDSLTVNASNYPSKTNINNAFSNFANSSKENSINIIYYSGHSDSYGSWLLATTDTTDGDTFDESDNIDENQFMRVDEVYELLKDVKGKKLIIVDSCYSGNYYTSSSYSLENEEITFTSAFNKLFTKDSKINDDTFILCATEKDNTSHEPMYEVGMRLHGFFTKALLEGLGWCDGIKGYLSDNIEDAYLDTEDGVYGKLSQGIPPAAKTNMLSVDNLLSYIIENQEIETSSDYFSHQYPQVLGERYDLVLFTY